MDDIFRTDHPCTWVSICNVKRSAIPLRLNKAVGKGGHETRLVLINFVKALGHADAVRDISNQRAANDNDQSRYLLAV